MPSIFMSRVTIQSQSDSANVSLAEAVNEPNSVGPASRRTSFLIGCIMLLTLGLLWYILINELRIEWEINPQYSYGMVVPLLCIGLVLRRWQSVSHAISISRSNINPSSISAFNFQLSSFSSLLPFIFIFGAFLLLPMRLLLEATPGWRTLNWLLACDVVALTLIAAYWWRGLSWLIQFAFPICFILVAVPWPHSIEGPLIQGLTRANTAITVELLAWLGIPASQQGNLIEISTGVVGVNEACSGIRSFQTSIMISFFFGEFYRFGILWRMLLVPIGFSAAFLFNVCRTTILTWIAAKDGVAAIETYHDQAGLTITIACTLVLWATAWLLQCRQQNNKIPPSADPTLSSLQSLPSSALLSSASLPLRRFLPTLLCWLVLVEAGVELWYRAHETRPRNQANWTLQWPPQATDLKEIPIPETTREMLKYDEGHAGTWSTAEVNWMLYYFCWKPGRLALASARSHSPDVCLPSAGKQLEHVADERSAIVVHSIPFPFTRYQFFESGKTFHVFHCIWEEHAPGQYFSYEQQLPELERRFKAVMKGQRNLGQRSIEIIVSGIEDGKQAEIAATEQLEQLIKVAL